MSNVKREMFGPPTNENLYVLASDYEACEKERDKYKEYAEGGYCYYRDKWEQSEARVKVLEEALKGARTRMLIGCCDGKDELCQKCRQLIMRVDAALGNEASHE
ncbi:MAG: hypothetical protein H7831_16355 [Magnetococcus sp. WYHC-3]